MVHPCVLLLRSILRPIETLHLLCMLLGGREDALEQLPRDVGGLITSLQGRHLRESTGRITYTEMCFGNCALREKTTENHTQRETPILILSPIRVENTGRGAGASRPSCARRLLWVLLLGGGGGGGEGGEEHEGLEELISLF